MYVSRNAGISSAAMGSAFNPGTHCSTVVLIEKTITYQRLIVTIRTSQKRFASKYILYLDMYPITQYCNPSCDKLDAAADDTVDAFVMRMGEKESKSNENVYIYITA